MSRNLSVGLLIGSEDVPAWFARGIEKIATDTEGTMNKIIVPTTPTAGPENKDIRFYIEDIKSKGCWAIVAAGQKFVNQFIGENPELKRRPITSIPHVRNANIDSCELIQSSPHRYSLPSTRVDSLRDLDILLHWGVGILDGAVLDAPTFGVWGIHHGDFRKYRGGPPGFWEYLAGEDTVTVTLQRFTDELDAGNIIVEVPIDVTNIHTLREIRRKQCQASVQALVDGVEKFSDGSEDTYTPEKLGPIHRPDDRDCRTTAKYISKAVPGWFKRTSSSLF
jgi:hypothetical protein